METLFDTSTLYGILFFVAIVLCALFAFFLLKKLGMKGQTRFILIGTSVLMGGFFAHLFYCFMTFTLTLSERGPLYFFAFYQGGYMLYGALAGGCLGAAMVAKLSGHKAIEAVDVLVPAGALTIALARFLEGLNGQGFGPDLENEALQFFPLAIFDGYYETWYIALFILEGLWAFFIALWLFKRKNQSMPGDQLGLLLLFYAAVQIFFESVRQDDVLRWGFVRCSQVISALTVAAVLAFYQKKRGATSVPRVLSEWLVLLLLMGICIAMEFAREQKIEWLLFMNETLCHITMIAAIFGMLALVMQVRRRVSPITFQSPAK